jgi:pyruvate/2-oxoglutarate dehydrogenase complex dihydrolipoamide acyltransferase (E2) component
VLTLRFSYDERVEDGLYAARALRLLAERIEHPAGWLDEEARSVA